MGAPAPESLLTVCKLLRKNFCGSFLYACQGKKFLTGGRFCDLILTPGTVRVMERTVSGTVMRRRQGGIAGRFLPLISLGNEGRFFVLERSGNL